MRDKKSVNNTEMPVHIAVLFQMESFNAHPSVMEEVVSSAMSQGCYRMVKNSIAYGSVRKLYRTKNISVDLG